jgi:hypothetical protein
MLHGLIPRSRQAEVLPVPQHWIDRLWEHAARWLRHIPQFDLDRAHNRLLSGEDRLWLAVITKGNAFSIPSTGVLITSVRDKPPINQIPSNMPRAFRRQDPADRRSLVVHMAEGKNCGLWIDSAVERISAYGREQGCHMLFLLAKKGWRQFAVRFWSPYWDAVGISRDRTVFHSGHNHYKRLNRPGWYRVVQPVEKMTKKHWKTGTMCYFQANGSSR